MRMVKGFFITSIVAASAVFGQEKDRDYSSVDFSSFNNESVTGKELEFSVYKKKGYEFLCVNLDRCWIVFYFKEVPKIESHLFSGESCNIKNNTLIEAVVTDRESRKKFFCKNCEEYKKNKELDFVASSEDCRVDIFTSANGEIGSVQVVYEKKPGGLNENRRFEQLFDLYHSKETK